MLALKPSSTIQSTGYDYITEILTITFKGYGIYEYADFDPEDVHDFEQAPSAGKFFHSRIKGKYRWRKLGEDEWVEVAKVETQIGLK